MAIVEQTAIPVPAVPRRRGALRLVPPRRPIRSLAKISALLLVTALGASLAAGVTGIGLFMLVAKLGG